MAERSPKDPSPLRIAQWGAIGLDVAVLTAFAIIFSGDIRLAVIAFLGLLLVCNTAWLLWSVRPVQQLATDYNARRARKLDKRFGTQYGHVLMPSPKGPARTPIITLRPPNHRSIAMEGGSPFDSAPGARCVVRSGRTEYPCTNTRQSGVLIVADYPAALTEPVNVGIGSIPRPGRYVAIWRCDDVDVRLPRLSMRWGEFGPLMHPMKALGVRFNFWIRHLNGGDTWVT